MALLGKLTDVRCRTAGPGTYGDGGGLLLQVRRGANGLTRSWVYRYIVNGKQTWMGLGSYPIVTLARAREKAMDARRQRSDGIDPLVSKRAVRASVGPQNPSPPVTFEQAALAYHTAHSAGWRSRRHTLQWLQSLTDHCGPLMDMPVDQVDTAAILRVLQPFWASNPVTASRVRGRIEVVLDAARVHGHRNGENPARWKGHLSEVLARPSKLAAVEHLASLPYSEVPALMQALRNRGGIAARALQFVVLTAGRAGECVGATWAELDLDAKLWSIPGHRMKSGRPHRVPLSDQALSVLQQMPRDGDLAFPVTVGALDRLRERMGLHTTVHGLRSSFRVWAAECTSFPAEIPEQALAHVTGSAVEQAYQRSDQLAKRTELMQRWADYCNRQSAEVIALRA